MAPIERWALDVERFPLFLPFQLLKLLRCPHSVAPTLVTLPSMSRVPRAPFSFQLSVSSLFLLNS